jgi:probable rRNA maturation factor
MKSDPHITYRRKPAALDLESLEQFAETLRTSVARKGEFHFRLTNDEELQSLNKRFLRKNYPTDVLSFPATFEDSLGDIAISLDRARAQAKEYGHSTEDEIRILMLHGLLHLKGLDHETDSGQMRRTEMRWRKKFGLPAGLIERAEPDRTKSDGTEPYRTKPNGIKQ